MVETMRALILLLLVASCLVALAASPASPTNKFSWRLDGERPVRLPLEPTTRPFHLKLSNGVRSSVTAQAQLTPSSLQAHSQLSPSSASPSAEGGEGGRSWGPVKGRVQLQTGDLQIMWDQARKEFAPSIREATACNYGAMRAAERISQGCLGAVATSVTNAAYLRIPKCGNTNIIRNLQTLPSFIARPLPEQETGNDVEGALERSGLRNIWGCQSTPITVVQPLRAPHIQRYFTFAREPLARFISVYTGNALGCRAAARRRASGL